VEDAWAGAQGVGCHLPCGAKQRHTLRSAMHTRTQARAQSQRSHCRQPPCKPLKSMHHPHNRSMSHPPCELPRVLLQLVLQTLKEGQGVSCGACMGRCVLTARLEGMPVTPGDAVNRASTLARWLAGWLASWLGCTAWEVAECWPKAPPQQEQERTCKPANHLPANQPRLAHVGLYDSAAHGDLPICHQHHLHKAVVSNVAYGSSW